MENTVTTLTKQLVAIPSFVSSTNDETKLLAFLATYCKENFPLLQQEKQYIDKKRYNLICKGQGPLELVVLMHVDTVQPQNGWNTDPFKAVNKNGKLFGLGAGDMKGATAAFITALQQITKEIDINKVMLIFYIDEEYDFKGMKKLIQSLKEDPQMYLSLDGDRLKVVSGCRGVIELNMQFLGKSGHSSDPSLGINAIRKATELVSKLEEIMKKYKDKTLGETTVNLAYLQGGVAIKENQKRTWLREGNVIPDYVDCTIEIRPSIKKVTAPFVIDTIKTLAKKLSLQVDDITIRHDIAPWPASYKNNQLKNIKNAFKNANIPFKINDNNYSGYVDVQMLSEKIKAPIYVIGVAGGNLHGANEYVEIKSLEKAVTLYKSVIQIYCI